MWKRLAPAFVRLLFVLLCVLLLVIAGLFIKTTLERDELKRQHFRLQTSNNITAEEKDNLQASLCKLGERIFDDYKCLTGFITVNNTRIVRE